MSGCAQATGLPFPATDGDPGALVQLLVAQLAGKRRTAGWLIIHVTVAGNRLQQPIVFTLSHS